MAEAACLVEDNLEVGSRVVVDMPVVVGEDRPAAVDKQL